MLELGLLTEKGNPTSSQGIANQCFDKLLFSKKDLYQFVLLLPVQRFGMTAGVAQPTKFF